MAVIEKQTSELEIYYYMSEKSIVRVEGQARDTKKRLEKEAIIDFTTNVVNLQNDITTMQKLLKQAKIEGNKEAQIILQMDITHLKSQLTEAKRELNNYMNTGNEKVSRLQIKFNSVTTEIKLQREELVKLGKDTSGIDKVIKKYEELHIKFQQGLISSKQFEKGINDLQKSTTLLNAIYTKVVDTIGNLILKIGDGILKLTKGIVSLGANYQQTQTIFTTMLGDFGKANQLLKEIDNLKMDGAREYAKSLLAYGIEAQNVIPTLNMLRDVSLGNSEVLERIAFNYGQIKSVGTASAMDLKQFAMAGIPIYEQLAESMGKSVAEVKDMTITFDMVEKAFQRMTSEGGMFYGMAEQQSKTLAGQWATLKVELKQLGEQIGLYLLPVLTKLVEWINYILDAFVGFAGFVSPLFTTISGRITIIVGLTAGFLALGPAIGVATTAIIGFSVALGPVVIAITAVTGAVLILGKAYKELQEANEELAKSEENSIRIQKEYYDEIRKYQEEAKKLEKIDKDKAKANEMIAKGLLDIKNGEEQRLRVQKELEAENKKWFKDEEKILNLEKDLLKWQKQIDEGYKNTTIARQYLGNVEEKQAQISLEEIQNQINGYNDMQDKIAELQNQLNNTTANTTAYEAIKAELDAIIEKAGIAKEELVASGVVVPESGKIGETKKSGGGGGKTAEQKRLEKEEKAIEEWLKTEINALKKANLSQKEYVEKAKKLYSEAEDKKFKLTATELELEEKAIEKIEEELEAEEERLEEEREMEEKRNESLEKRIEKINENKEVYIKAIEKTREATEKNIDDIKEEIGESGKSGLIKTIEDLTDKILKLEETAGGKLANRSLGITDEIVKAEEKIVELKSKGIGQMETQYLLQKDFLKSQQQAGNSEVNGYNVKDLLSYLEEQEKIVELNKENEKIQEYINKEGNEHLKELFKINEEYEKMSKAEQIIADFESERLTLEQTKALREEDLEAKEIKLLTEKEYYDNLGKAKELIEEHYQKKVEDIEKSITNTIYHETEQRKKYLKELEEQAIKTVNALKSAGISGSSAISSSNNSGNSNNTSNVNVNMGGVIINNDADIDAVANTIADRVLLAEKGIYQ